MIQDIQTHFLKKILVFFCHCCNKWVMNMESCEKNDTHSNFLSNAED